MKKGLSPVIATVLLISIALILAIIIFLWARSFISEQTQKFDEPVENACRDVSFDAEVYYDGAVLKAAISNNGNVPIYGVEIRQNTLGSSETVAVSQGEGTIASGESEIFELNDVTDSLSEQEISIIPIIIGQNNAGAKRAYPCDDDYAVDTVVS